MIPKEQYTLILSTKQSKVLTYLPPIVTLYLIPSFVHNDIISSFHIHISRKKTQFVRIATISKMLNEQSDFQASKCLFTQVMEMQLFFLEFIFFQNKRDFLSRQHSIPCPSHNIELCFYAQTYSKEIFPERKGRDITYKNTSIYELMIKS